MQKKFSFTFLVIVLLFFIFSISSYANTDYSVYNKDNNTYHLKLSFKKLLNLDIPEIENHVEYSSSDIYFMLIQTSTGYTFYSSSSPFVFKKYDFYNNPQVYTKDSTPYNYIIYSNKTSSWGEFSSSNIFIGMYKKEPLLINSDDITNEEGTQIFYEHTSFYSPLVKTVRSIKTMNSVTYEIISILPVILTLVVGLIGVRKAISFIRKKIRNA